MSQTAPEVPRPDRRLTGPAAPAQGRARKAKGPECRAKFFQIGFNKCGTTFIARLFDMNAIPAAHWLEGALADDIAYARLTGAKPLARWADRITAFTDMESVRFLNMPVIEAFRDFALLDAHYPGAVFLLNTRRVEDWIASRYLHRDGDYARSVAADRGVALGDLADLWAADWEAHLTAARRHFGDRPEFLEIDIDHATPEDYRRALSPWFDLPRIPDLPGAGVRRARLRNLPRGARMLDAPLPGADQDPARRDRLARRLARLARPALLLRRAATRAPHDQALCLDLTEGVMRDAGGRVMPLRRGPDGRFHLDSQRPGLLRPAAVANDIAGIAREGLYWLDMRPATFAGSGPDDPAHAPLIAGLRRKGAQNLFLWPAPWHHRIGNRGFPGSTSPSPAARDAAVVWRGTLSGHDPISRLTAEAAVTALLADPGDAAARGAVTRGPRWRFLAERAADPALDLALLADPRRDRALAGAGLTAPVPCAPPRAGRLHLCLSGSEGDADLLPLAFGHATVIRQQDGWESFVTGLFQPWTHVIPMAEDGSDLEARLAWAADHPDDCRRMSERCRRLCAGLGDPAGRRLHLSHLLADYRRATRQD